MDAVPTKTPVTRTLRGSAPPAVPDERSWQLDHSSGGVPGIHCCHSPSTSAAALHGYCRVNSAMSGMGWASKVNDVTTPKLPPPPPLDAHSRSSWSRRSAVTTRASAVTISTAAQVVAGEPVLAPEDTDAPAEGEPGDAHRRARAAGSRRPDDPERAVDVDQPGAGADGGGCRPVAPAAPGSRGARRSR